MSNSPYQYFSTIELTCWCGCGRMEMDSTYMAKVVAMRRECGFPFNVTSAFRCPEHNAKVSKTGLSGPHTTGRALDVAVTKAQEHAFTKSAFDHGMTGFGFNLGSFIHIDDLETGPRPNMWDY